MSGIHLRVPFLHIRGRQLSRQQEINGIDHRGFVILPYAKGSLAWRQRLILEAWHSLRNRNTINEHMALPNIYNNIKNF